MKLGQKLSAAAGFAEVRLLGHRVPVAVRINLNNRCHSKCDYCSFWHTETQEMSTVEHVRIVRELAALGTRRLSLSGGEPMLRKDLGEIVAAAADAGISVGLNSTGFLFDKRPDELRRLDLVKLSLDGPREVHDSIRGRPGAFDELLRAIEVVRRLGIKHSFTFTINRANVDHVPWALDFARRHGTFIAFQPVMAVTHASEHVASTFPDEADYRRAIDWLIEQKQRDGGALRNSLGGLRHVRGWPDIEGLACWSGEVFVMIEPNGDVVPCDRIEYDEPIPSCREHGVAWALSRLPRVRCEGCGFCGSVEINMLMAGRFDVLPAIGRVVAGGQSSADAPVSAPAPRRVRLPVL